MISRRVFVLGAFLFLAPLSGSAFAPMRTDVLFGRSHQWATFLAPGGDLIIDFHGLSTRCLDPVPARGLAPEAVCPRPTSGFGRIDVIAHVFRFDGSAASEQGNPVRCQSATCVGMRVSFRVGPAALMVHEIGRAHV